jgi:hypothetical protein
VGIVMEEYKPWEEEEEDVSSYLDILKERRG